MWRHRDYVSQVDVRNHDDRDEDDDIEAYQNSTPDSDADDFYYGDNWFHYRPNSRTDWQVETGNCNNNNNNNNGYIYSKVRELNYNIFECN